MKTLFTTLLLLTAQFGFAVELSSQQLSDEILNHRNSFEEIHPGMTSEYLTNSFIEMTDNRYDLPFQQECRRLEKSVIISTNPPGMYLQYKEVTNLNDCLDLGKKGFVTKNLEWIKILKVEDLAPSLNLELNYLKIDKEGTLVTTKGSIRILGDESVEIFETQIDLDKSQFFRLVDEKWGKFRTILIKRGTTDPSSIDLSGVKIIENNI